MSNRPLNIAIRNNDRTKSRNGVVVVDVVVVVVVVVVDVVVVVVVIVVVGVVVVVVVVVIVVVVVVVIDVVVRLKVVIFADFIVVIAFYIRFYGSWMFFLFRSLISSYYGRYNVGNEKARKNAKKRRRRNDGECWRALYNARVVSK